MKSWDEDCIRIAIGVAAAARRKGNHPFGALLADHQGKVLLTAENSVNTDKDCTAHAETNLVRKACQTYDHDFLMNCTLYTSTEPCPMCAGAIFWSNIRRVVYGLSEERLYTITGGNADEVLYFPCRELFEKGKKQIEIIGPLLEDEAVKVHEGFW